jgi:hypothetical protein
VGVYQEDANKNNVPSNKKTSMNRKKTAKERQTENDTA